MMKRMYVEFFSPGTFVSETSLLPIESQDIRKAVEMSKSIKERHSASPYGFQFVEMIEADDVMGSDGKPLKVTPREVSRTGTYFITGTVCRFHEIPATKENDILRSNMRSNRMPLVVENRNSYRFTGEFTETDCIVGWDGTIVVRGDDAGLREYRENTIAEWEAYWAAERKKYASA